MVMKLNTSIENVQIYREAVGLQSKTVSDSRSCGNLVTAYSTFLEKYNKEQDMIIVNR